MILSTYLGFQCLSDCKDIMKSVQEGRRGRERA